MRKDKKMKKVIITRRTRMRNRRTRLTDRKPSQFISICALLLDVGITLPSAQGSDRDSIWNAKGNWAEAAQTSPLPVTPELIGQTCTEDLPDGTCPSEKLFGKLDVPFGIPDKLTGKCPTEENKIDSSKKNEENKKPLSNRFKSLSSSWNRFKSLSSRLNHNRNQSQPQKELLAIDPPSKKEIARREFIGIEPNPSPHPVPPGQMEQCPGD